VSRLMKVQRAGKKSYQGRLNMTANNRQSNKYKYKSMFEIEIAVLKILNLSDTGY